MIADDNVPALIDLQVLSPMAWVKRENERQGTGKINLMPRRALLYYLKEQTRLIEGSLPLSESSDLTEEQRRHLEWHLIQTASLAMRWIETLRTDDSERPPLVASGTQA